MQNIVDYIKINWDILPKSKFNELCVVIFKEIKNDDHGYGHHVYEGYGVVESGDVVWCYSSGCSCGGSVDTSIKKDLKVFSVEGGIEFNNDPKSINWNGLQVEYNDY